MVNYNSQVWKNQELEGFLFDLDTPHLRNLLPDLAEAHNQNILKALKRRAPRAFGELKQRIAQTLMEFERVQYNVGFG